MKHGNEIKEGNQLEICNDLIGIDDIRSLRCVAVSTTNDRERTVAADMSEWISENRERVKCSAREFVVI